MRNPGEPRDSTEPALRERKRPKCAFGSLPYRTTAAAGNSVYVKAALYSHN